jgi:hypothetical protein
VHHTARLCRMQAPLKIKAFWAGTNVPHSGTNSPTTGMLVRFI